jgi:hypothetical protein
MIKALVLTMWQSFLNLSACAKTAVLYGDRHYGRHSLPSS